MKQSTVAGWSSAITETAGLRSDIVSLDLYAEVKVNWGQGQVISYLELHGPFALQQLRHVFHVLLVIANDEIASLATDVTSGCVGVERTRFLVTCIPPLKHDDVIQIFRNVWLSEKWNHIKG